MRRRLVTAAGLGALLLGGVAPAGAAQVTVNFSDNAFMPASVSINAGDDVFWCGNSSNQKTHSITASDGSFTRDVPPRSGCTWLTFQQNGRFPYYCKFVDGMTGTVNVGIESPPSPPSTTRTTVAVTPTTTVAATRSTTTSRRAVAVAVTRTTAVGTTGATDPTVQVLGDAPEETTSTATGASLAIREQSPADDGGTSALALAGVLAAIAAGAGYVFARGRALRLRR